MVPVIPTSQGRQPLTSQARYVSGPWEWTSAPRRAVTSAPSNTGRGELIHCQVQLANHYQNTLNTSSRLFYARELLSGIADLCGVDDKRISDVGVFENPQTGATFISHVII